MVATNGFDLAELAAARLLRLAHPAAAPAEPAAAAADEPEADEPEAGARHTCRQLSLPFLVCSTAFTCDCAAIAADAPAAAAAASAGGDVPPALAVRRFCPFTAVSPSFTVFQRGSAGATGDASGAGAAESDAVRWEPGPAAWPLLRPDADCRR